MSRKMLLDSGWLFHYGEADGADYMGYDDRAWIPVTLPHDWAVMFPFDRNHSSGTGYLPGGTAWYRRHLNCEEEIEGKQFRILFEGVYNHARVWVNSNYLGEHAYGYTSFAYDVTEFIRKGENVISVRVDHAHTADSRWFTGSGIDRHVRLEVSEKIRFRPDSIFAVTEEADENQARITITFKTTGAEETKFTLLDAEGREIASAEGGDGRAELKVESPRLWGPDDPYLYTLVCEAKVNGETTDREEIPFGIRTIRFDADEGFFLNGENMKMKGVCVHHDAGALGAAVPKSVWRRRLEKFKASGCNAIRTSHNPPDPDLLDLCDEMGFLVMDEAFDEWEGIKNKWWQGHNVYPPKHYGYGMDFPMNHRVDLESMVKRDRNHACVVLWSIGNEIDYPNDPYVTPLFKETLGNNDAGKPAAERMYDNRKPDAGRLATVARELVDIVHEMDTTRPVLSALSFPELSTRTGFADQLDLSGYNYREHFYEEDHRRFPGRVILGSENSHDPEAWMAVKNHPYISAQFLWTGVDFLGECRGWPVRISQAGMMDLAGFEKPLYWRRKALWSDEPFAKIAVGPCKDDGETMPWDESFCWQGADGEEKTVSVYTNQSEAELFLNGESLGKKTLTEADGGRTVWKVKYASGELTARAGDAEDRLRTAGTPGKLSLNVISPRKGEAQVFQIELGLMDESGNPCADEVPVRSRAVGDAEVIGIENGCPDDLTPYFSDTRKTFGGKQIIYVRLTGPEAEICLNAGFGTEKVKISESEIL